ncbi:hypothetical protein JYT16_00415 [Gemmatimonas aurantiaca]|nr:hypothetical protein [Gemmatimonas aurantiaca]
MSDIKKLIDGYRRFHDKYFRSSNNLFSSLQGGQTPSALMISCSDSRVDPSLLTEAEPGDLFVVRNIANLVPSADCGDFQVSVIASVEFAVNVLRVGHIIVMGHSQCKGVETLIRQTRGEETLESVSVWVDCASKVATAVIADHPDEPLERQSEICAHKSVLASLDNLRKLPFLERSLSSGVLQLHGWFFDIETGEMSEYDFTEKKFKPLI